jgi:hypothetical protein
MGRSAIHTSQSLAQPREVDLKEIMTMASAVKPQSIAVFKAENRCESCRFRGGDSVLCLQ